MSALEAGTRVVVTDWSDENSGAHGTVIIGEHRAVLTGRPMVEVRMDGREWMYDVGLYVEQVDELPAPVSA